MVLPKLRIGQLVQTSDGRQGTVRYIGAIHVAKGEWCGLELADDSGKNDGSVQGHIYFACEPNHGIFVKKDTIVQVLGEPDAPPRPAARRSVQPANEPMATTAAKPRQSSNMSSGTAKNRQSMISTNSNSSQTGSRASAISPAKSPVKMTRASVSSSTASTPRTATPATTARTSQVSAKSRLSATGTTQMLAPPPKKPVAASRHSTSVSPAPARTASSPVARLSVRTPSRTTTSGLGVNQTSLEQMHPPEQKESTHDEEQLEKEERGEQEEDGDVEEPEEDNEEQEAEDHRPRPDVDLTIQGTLSNTLPRTLSKGEPPPVPNGIRSTREHSTSNTNGAQPESTAALHREIESLRVKLRTMETRRKEDREKIKQIDTQQSRNDQLEAIIRTMETKLKQSNEEKRLAQANYEDIKRRLAAEPEMPAQFESELELAILDKEMAEEKAVVLQLELDELKEKYAEMGSEIEILRGENKELTSGISSEERASAGWLHLEHERDRLKDALLALRDQKVDIETELKEEIAHLEKEFEEAEETAGKYIEAAEAVQRLEDINAALKEQLEAAENQEDIVSSMMEERERHLQVIERLRVQNSELEELAQTNADLETLYVDNERGLQSRIDEQEVYLNEQAREKAEQDKVIEDLGYTLNKFRDVVQGLQGQIDEARRSREISEMQAHEMKDKSKTMMDLNIRLQASATKSQSKTIDAELVKAQARTAQKHVQILSMFLSDSFDDDHNPTQAYLAFGQLKSKAALVRSILSDRLRDRAHVDTTEEVVQAYKIVQLVSWIQHSADRFERFIHTCSSEEFLAFSNTMSDIDPVQRAVDGWLGALRNDEFGVDGPEHMKRMQGILLDLEEKLIPASSESHANIVSSHTRMIESYSDVASSMLNWVTSYVQSHLGEPNDEDSWSIDFDRRLDQIGTKLRTIKYHTGKITAELDKLRSQHQCPEEPVLSLFSTAEQDAAVVCDEVEHIVQTLTMQLDNIAAERSSYDQLLRATINTDALGNRSDTLDRILSNLNELQVKIELLSAKAADHASMMKFEPKQAPWLVRSKELKARKINMSQMQDDLQRAQRLNAEHISRSAEKERAIEELSIRAELAEKRAKDTRAKDQSDKAFKEEIEALTKTQADLQKRLDKLQTDYDNLEITASQDQRDLEALRTAASNSAKDAVTVDSRGFFDAALATQYTTQIKLLEAEILLLRSTVRYLHEVNHALSVPVSEVDFQTARDAWLHPDLLTARERGIKTRQRTHKALLAAEGKDVMQDLIDLASNLQPVSLVRRQPTPVRDRVWPGHVPTKETTRYKVAKQKEELEQWNSWREDLATRIDLARGGRVSKSGDGPKRSKVMPSSVIRGLNFHDHTNSKSVVVGGRIEIVDS